MHRLARFTEKWMQGVNAHGGFGAWRWAVSKDPGHIQDILSLIRRGQVQCQESYPRQMKNKVSLFALAQGNAKPVSQGSIRVIRGHSSFFLFQSINGKLAQIVTAREIEPSFLDKAKKH